MERKENFNESKGSAAAASKMSTGRKQSGNEASASPAKGTSQNQGTSQQNMSSNQGATGQQKNQGATGANGGDQDLLQHAKQATSEIVSQVQQRAGSTLAQQKDSAAGELTQVVQAVRQFGESLSGQESGPIARYAAEYGDKAADSLERLSTYIREQDPKRLLNDVQNFGRRRPALLLGGAFLLGFAGARLIRSSMDAGSQHPSGVNSRAATPSMANVPAGRPPTANVTAVRPPTSPNAL